MERYYHLCKNHQGKVVRITERGGRVHVGRITRVTRDRVFIAPTGGGQEVSVTDIGAVIGDTEQLTVFPSV